MKKINEKQLKTIVAESIKKALNEGIECGRVDISDVEIRNNFHRQTAKARELISGPFNYVVGLMRSGFVDDDVAQEALRRLQEVSDYLSADGEFFKNYAKNLDDTYKRRIFK